MERRNFLKQNMLATGALLGTTSLMASNSNNAAKKDAVMENTATFKCNYAFHDGMFRNTAGPDFIEQIKYAHSMGFRSIEDNGMMGRTPEMQQKIGDTLASLGMNMGVFVIAFSNNDKIAIVNEFDGIRISNIYHYIMMNYHNQLTLEQIAKEANMTPQAFCSYFKKRTSKTL
jgi:YesN/AraC family two-component response regulator